MIYEGEEKLKRQAENGFPKGITKICNRVYFALGYGGSTCTLVIGEESCILVDTLNGVAPAMEARKEFEKLTDKPVRTIIYTHYFHFDHTSGASVFAGPDTRIIGRKPTYPQYGRTGLIKDICGVRGARQFGVGLTPEENICVGIGPRNEINGEKGSLPCREFFEEEELELEIDGTKVVLAAAPGETDDQIFVWFPQHRVLCCGDNYYESWPNLYAIRGGQYRDISGWIDSLDKMREYRAEYLLPGHTRAVIGSAEVETTLKNYRDALEYVLTETLHGMNEGRTPDELADSVRLPKHLASLPYLQEYYGTVEWSVRSIYTGYLGWFDGNPTKLGHMNTKERAEKTVAMMGGAGQVLAEGKAALERGEAQWAAELCDLLIDCGQEMEAASGLKADALTELGRRQTSANARHYYLACARQLRGNGETLKLNGAMLDVGKKQREA